MRSFLLATSSALLLAATSFGAIAQTTDGTVSAPSFDRVLQKCKEVSDNPDIADPRFGICVTETRNYISSLSSLPQDVVQPTLVDLVVALGELSRVNPKVLCTEFDDEIAQAILIASRSSTDPEQAARIQLIAETIADSCGTPAVVTAAIASLE